MITYRNINNQVMGILTILSEGTISAVKGSAPSVVGPTQSTSFISLTSMGLQQHIGVAYGGIGLAV